MPPKTRSQTPAITDEVERKQEMAASDPNDIVAAEAEIRASKDPNRLLLLNILANQKTLDDKQEQRYNNLDALIQASKSTLEKHIKENDTVINSIKTNVTANTNDIASFQVEVTKLKTDLVDLQVKYDASQLLLTETKTHLADFAKTLSKLDTKFCRDEEDQMRCQIVIDGVREQASKRPKSIAINLLKDLDIDFTEADIKSAYRLGPINDRATRPRSIKVQFSNNHFKFDIFKNIQKLKGKEQWKGVHISDAVSLEEQEKRRDLRCIYAAGKAKGIDVKLKGTSIVIDGIKFGHDDIRNLPKGLSIEDVKIVKTKDGTAFQSHHAYLSNMFPCKIIYEGLDYKSSEHLYFAEMARHHNRQDLVEEIRNSKDGYAAKRVASYPRIPIRGHKGRLLFLWHDIVTSQRHRPELYHKGESAWLYLGRIS